MKSDTAQPPEKSALDFGCEDQNGFSPVYFVVVTLPSLHPSALQSLPSTYLNCHEQISFFSSDRIILPQSF
jgi:hypothetical protein